MKLELHIIQSFAPSNLNRDDTGSPKDCEFGGVRRARISSQCWKRAIREHFNAQGFAPDRSGARSRKIARFLADQMETDETKRDQAQRVIGNALRALKLKTEPNGDLKTLLFVSQSSLEPFKKACEKHWETLAKIKSAKESENRQSGKSKKEPKLVSTEIANELGILFRSGKELDLALFGRMIADEPGDNVDAASQVAHAISTHRSDLEFDYFTAVDDLQPSADTGAGMIGSLEFNAACYYRYCNVDVGQLSRNLTGDRSLVQEGLRSFLTAAVLAVPSGKQNNTAAQNPPSFVLVVVRPSGLWSLANAFLKPVRPRSGGDLAEASIVEMSTYWKKLDAVYGTPEQSWLGYASLHEGAWTADGESLKLRDLVAAAVATATAGLS